MILVFLFVVPKYKKSNELQNTLAKKQAEYDGKSVYYAKISELIKNIESKNDALEKINSALPSNFSLSSLVYFLQKKAAEAGLVTKLIVFSKIPAKASDKKIGTINFTVNLFGNYQNLKDFIGALDKSSRLFNVNSINFTSANAQNLNQPTNKLQTYNFNLEIETYNY